MTLFVAMLFSNVGLTIGQVRNFYGDKINEELCGSLSFTYDEEPATLINNICSSAGIKNTFQMVRCDGIDNATALRKYEVDFILYDPKFLKKVKSLNMTITKLLPNRGNVNWGAVTILAHEIGHHVLKHLYDDRMLEPSKRINFELEADRFAGGILCKLGATVKQAQEIMYDDRISSEVQDKLYPTRSRRLAAVAAGYQACRESFAFGRFSAAQIFDNITLHVRIDRDDRIFTGRKWFKKKYQNAFHYYIDGKDSYLNEIKEIRYVRNHETFYEFNDNTYQSSVDRAQLFDFKSYQWGYIDDTYVVVVTKSGDISKKLLKKIIYDN